MASRFEDDFMGASLSSKWTRSVDEDSGYAAKGTAMTLRHPVLIHVDKPELDQDHSATGPTLGRDTDRCATCDAPVKVELRSKKPA